jgi:serine/threonine protein phosphatase 1
MSGLLSRIFGKRRAAASAWAPDGTVIYAIGDVHGRSDLLRLLLTKIEADAAGETGTVELIFLGDYVDRGRDSRGVVDAILELAGNPRLRVYALKGNHEEAVLTFLTDPATGPAWSQHGGRETLQSYGVTPPASVGQADWAAIRDEFVKALPPAHRSFFQSLEAVIERGDYVFVHAGLRPGTPIAQQAEQDLLWIRQDFLMHEGRHEKVVVHGHTPEPEPFLGEHRIGVDTGAYATNVLTAVKLKGAERSFLSVRAVPAMQPLSWNAEAR